jgi:hypothetical protein
VRRAGVEPAQRFRGWVTATEARQCPADATVVIFDFQFSIVDWEFRELCPPKSTIENHQSKITPMAQVGFEPTASLVLSESGLPVAYRAR